MSATESGAGKTGAPPYRLRHVVTVEVKADLVSERATSHDISVGGMFVDSALDYVPGMQVHLSFELGGRTLALNARIIHVQPMVGFGVSFVGLTPEQRGRILRFVHSERASREAEQFLSADD